MANSVTEHTKKLRAKTAAEWNKKQLAEGKQRKMNIQMTAELADEFDAILKELGSSRPQAIKALCEFYRQHSK